jgi:hypothetical protein
MKVVVAAVGKPRDAALAAAMAVVGWRHFRRLLRKG